MTTVERIGPYTVIRRTEAERREQLRQWAAEADAALPLSARDEDLITRRAHR